MPRLPSTPSYPLLRPFIRPPLSLRYAVYMGSLDSHINAALTIIHRRITAAATHRRVDMFGYPPVLTRYMERTMDHTYMDRVVDGDMGGDTEGVIRPAIRPAILPVMLGVQWKNALGSPTGWGSFGMALVEHMMTRKKGAKQGMTQGVKAGACDPFVPFLMSKPDIINDEISGDEDQGEGGAEEGKGGREGHEGKQRRRIQSLTRLWHSQRTVRKHVDAMVARGEVLPFPVLQAGALGAPLPYESVLAVGFEFFETSTLGPEGKTEEGAC